MSEELIPYLADKFNNRRNNVIEELKCCSKKEFSALQGKLNAIDDLLIDFLTDIENIEMAKNDLKELGEE